MFLVQLGALALWAAKRNDLSVDAADWAVDLRRLTRDHTDDAPWRLTIDEREKPAFLQPPDPGGLKWSAVATPDALDMLIISTICPDKCERRPPKHRNPGHSSIPPASNRL